MIDETEALTEPEHRTLLILLESDHLEAVILLSTKCPGCRAHMRSGVEKLKDRLKGISPPA